MGYNDVQFKLIGRDYGPFDFAAIPIGVLVNQGVVYEGFSY